ncbi:MAG TPA: multicopper oxidase family protein [Burkholderiales bacterium]|nr:multicopper oxidase family protein [Burkholderiales bacterium]
MPDRRAFLRTAAALAAAPLVAPASVRAGPVRPFALEAKPTRVDLVGDPYPPTGVWSYNATVPGPELRVKQGERLRVTVANSLEQTTSVHWHGVRVPNAMDGVPGVTQPPIAANGGTFVYEFDVPDAGTYWYHPHSRSYEQVARGLAGILVVEDREPFAADRDVTWVLQDWRLARDAQLRADFGNMMDRTHAGRIGNTVTVNGVVAESFDVRAGERLRLRLANLATARVFGLAFRGHRPVVIAYDGQPVEPHEPEQSLVVLGPGERVDVVLDMTAAPGERFDVIDRFYRQNTYRLLSLEYGQTPPLRTRFPGAPRLAPNPTPEVDLARAARHEVLFRGGMGPGMMGPGMMGRGMGGMGMMGGMTWSINGVAVDEGHAHEPLFVLERGRTYVLALANDTNWHHPMHLHGHFFRVLSRNGRPTRRREWRDTVLLAPNERAEIAFVADNPGDWMFHCHVLEHQASGMMATLRVV